MACRAFSIGVQQGAYGVPSQKSAIGVDPSILGTHANECRPTAGTLLCLTSPSNREMYWAGTQDADALNCGGSSLESPRSATVTATTKLNAAPPARPETIRAALWLGDQLDRQADKAVPSVFVSLVTVLPGHGRPWHCLRGLLAPRPAIDTRYVRSRLRSRRRRPAGSSCFWTRCFSFKRTCWPASARSSTSTSCWSCRRKPSAGPATADGRLGKL